MFFISNVSMTMIVYRVFRIVFFRFNVCSVMQYFHYMKNEISIIKNMLIKLGINDD